MWEKVGNSVLAIENIEITEICECIIFLRKLGHGSQDFKGTLSYFLTPCFYQPNRKRTFIRIEQKKPHQKILRFG